MSPPKLILETTAYTIPQLPGLDVAQVALAGRSNVGKSSLLNCLAGRKSLAKISSTPGKTRSLNFFRVEGHPLYLVDLPGYGYAARAKTERRHWAGLVDRFLTASRNLKAVVALLDCRLPPQRLDLELVAHVQDLGLALVPVLTKADKCKQNERAERVRQWHALTPAAELPILFASTTGLGRDALWARLLTFAGGPVKEYLNGI